MKLFKRTVASVLALLFVFSLSAVMPKAADAEKWTFIDGINITRSVNTAIIYRGINSTGQNQWGHNVVVDAEGTVTDIIQGGDSAGSNLAVPEGGMVISSAGTKIQWFKDNIKKGSTVFYDSYTQRLFICDANGGFDPYFVKETAISGDIGKYYLADPTLEGLPIYSYSVAVNAEGKVISRGGWQTAPEGGFTVSAGTKSDAAFLIMYAPVGAKCVIENSKAVFSYDKTMLKDTFELSLASAKAAVEGAKAEYSDFDITKAEGIIASAETVDSTKLDSKTAAMLAYSLDTELSSALADSNISELRGAFHVPEETSKGAVRKTLNSVKASGLNTIILRLSNGYGSFIPLSADSKFAQDERFGGFDVLEAYIDLCEEMDIGLTLCIDVYYNEYASIAAPEWLSKTNGSAKGLSDRFFSPANSEFEEYFISYVDYIISRYKIRSLMFDSLRYPKFSEKGDLGYDDETLTLFSREYEIPIAQVEKLKTELFSSDHWKSWVEFRTGLVDHMAERISETVRAKRPDITITAVAARDSVDHYYMQNATGWIEEDIFDGLCVSVCNGIESENDPLPELGYYDDLAREKCETYAAYTDDKAYFFAALESDSTIGANLVSNAITSLRKLGSDGFVFSSLNGYIAQHYESFLNEGVLKNESVSPLGNVSEAMKAIIEYSKSKMSNTLVSLGGCDDATAALAGAKLNEALKLINEDEFGYEQAQQLESDIAIQFADSPAKESALKELKALTKLALLAKAEPSEILPPPEDESSDIGTESEPDVEASDAVSDDESFGESIDSSENPEEQSTSPLYPIEEEPKLEIGVILIYCFVGIALAAAIAGTVVAVKRGKNKPANLHMPKAALEEKDSDNENNG
ncbi:MAG: family 10 glycosylhydrolase [Clostridia bacterium]|nr:family 10 glycosylhydrolase [Clostridia bacterium]